MRRRYKLSADSNIGSIRQWTLGLENCFKAHYSSDELVAQVHCDPVKDKLAVLVGRKSGYPTPSFSDLKDAHKEVAAVAEALGRVTTCTVVLDNTPEMSTGMKERVTEILPNASWIHLAVHGEISPQFPQGSLLFGENNEQRLTATEIITSSMSSPWSARCVIASACQSGLGSVAGTLNP